MTTSDYSNTIFEHFLNSISKRNSRILVEKLRISNFSSLLAYIENNLAEIHRNEGRISLEATISLLEKMELFTNPIRKDGIIRWHYDPKKEGRRTRLLHKLRKSAGVELEESNKSQQLEASKQQELIITQGEADNIFYFLGKTYIKARGGFNKYERFCESIPIEMNVFLKKCKLDNFEALLNYLRENQEFIYTNNGNITVDEAVLLLLRMKNVVMFATRSERVSVVLYNDLKNFLCSSPNFTRTILRFEPNRHKCPCPACGEVYALEWLVWHIVKYHPKYKHTFECPFCGNKIRTDRSINHLSTHHSKELFYVFDSVKVIAGENNAVEQQTGINPATIEPPAIKQPAIEPPIVVSPDFKPPAQELSSESPASTQVHLSHLSDFRQVKRSRRLKQVKIVEDIGDRRYFVSQASLVKTERASRIHAEVLSILAGHLAAVGVESSETSLIDAYAEFQGLNIFEVKSINGSNEKSQIRHAIAQLYEYRYVYKWPNARLWLVLSRQPETPWILDYLLIDRDIAVLWVQDGCLAGVSLDLLSHLVKSNEAK